MAFKYRSPNDKSINLGGLGSVSSFNEFGGNFPPYGTFLYSTDTSRFENDAISVQYWMPYTTNFYANGQGGEYWQETWGLQYFPAGWVTSVSINTTQDSWDFYTFDNTHTTGNVDVLQETFHNTEDGTGINTPILYQSVLLTSPYQIIDSYFDGNTFRWYVQRNASNNGNELLDYTMYYQYGYGLGQSYGDAQLWISEASQWVVAGTEYYDNIADGYGGSISNLAYTYWSAGGTLLASWNQGNETAYESYTQQDYETGRTYQDEAVMDGGSPYGNGTYSHNFTYYGSYYSTGTFVNSWNSQDNQSSWNEYYFANGTGIQDVVEWNGSGGFQYQWGTAFGTYYPYGIYIGQYWTSYDGNYYELFWDGSGGIISYLV